MTVDYYDRQGQPISLEQWVESSTRENKRVAETQVGQICVSTVWLGLDHGYSRNDTHVPVIFETMAFGPASWGELEMDRYSTEAAALAGHDRIVALAREHHHGWTKRSRDERRHTMKQFVRLLDRERAGTLDETYERPLLEMYKLRRLGR